MIYLFDKSGINASGMRAVKRVFPVVSF